MLINEIVLTEAAVVTHGNHDLMQMLKSIFDKWGSDKHSKEEITQLLAAMGYRVKFDGDRAELVQEGRGDIRKALAGIAIIASLWGVNNHLAHKAYDASPQLQQLTALHQEAEAAGDEAAAENYADRIEQHKLRLDLGKGEVMGKDGRPVDVKRFGESAGKRTVYHVASWDDRFGDYTTTGTDVWKNPDRAIAWAKRQYETYGGRWQVSQYSNMKPKPHNWGTDKILWSSEQDPMDEAITVKDTVKDVEEKISMLQALRQAFAIDGDKVALKAINDKMRELLQKKKTMAGKAQ